MGGSLAESLWIAFPSTRAVLLHFAVCVCVCVCVILFFRKKDDFPTSENILKHGFRIMVIGRKTHAPK